MVEGDGFLFRVEWGHGKVYVTPHSKGGYPTGDPVVDKFWSGPDDVHTLGQIIRSVVIGANHKWGNR
jgi:hypothetical protein